MEDQQPNLDGNNTYKSKLDPKYLKLLIISSDIKTFNLVKENLTSHKESQLFNLDKSLSLSEAKTLTRDNNYDLIILDLDLHNYNLDTLEAFYTLRSFYKLPNILLLISETNEKLAVEALGQGAQDVFVKAHISKNSHGLCRCIRYCYERYRYINSQEHTNFKNSLPTSNSERIEELDKLIQSLE